MKTSASSDGVKEEAADELSSAMTDLALDGGIQVFLKRDMACATIEGSPMMTHDRKRGNFRPTPAAFRVPHIPNEPAAPDPPAQDKTIRSLSSRSKIYVLSSGSDAHDTKDHQENAQRTLLLCGEDGCLRRDVVKDSIVWIEDKKIRPASLADILRVHEYDYINHLENKVLQLSEDVSDKNRSTPVPSFYAPAGYLDSDTPLSRYSLDAAKSFCGAAIHAVDVVLSPSISLGERNPFYSTLPSTNSTPAGYREYVGYEGVGSPGDEAPSTVADRPTGTLSTPARYSRPGKGGSSSMHQDEKGDGRIRTAFVIGRPPGHHAGPNGCVPSDHLWLRPDMTSSGFCLLNTVGIAAAYARYNYSAMDCSGEVEIARGHPPGSRPLRIAIVDIDVHHGNGTEEIVRNLRPREIALPLPSSWAPITRRSYKPWLNEQDAKETMFASINLYADERFYPCSGADSDCTPIENDDQHIINIAMTPIGPGPWDMHGRQKLTNKLKKTLIKQASDEMREKVTTRLLPRLQEFSPDLLFFSAGFDAIYDDMYHFLDEDDFHWLTSSVKHTSKSVISVLEGGYSLSSPVPKSKGRATKDSQDGSSKTSPRNKYAVQPGDGGLVKGVLAHVAALAEAEDWFD